MGSKTDYFENKLTDHNFRGQPLTIGAAVATWSTPPTFYFGLLKALPVDATATPSEITGGSYARQPVIASLANFAGTQAAASTTASSGAGGTTSNNTPVVFTGMPDTTGVNSLNAFGIFDAATGGNLLEYAALNGAPISATAGATLTFNAASMTLQEDN